jgi:hypothetical protein
MILQLTLLTATQWWGGIGGLDVGGNPFGTDFSNDHMTSSTFDDSWSSSSGCNFSDW